MSKKIHIINIFLTFILLAALLIMGTVFVIGKFFGGYFFNTSGTAVIKEIQNLNRLETASFTIEKIIDAGTQGNTFQQFLFGDNILLIADGQVIAGFDLSTMSKNDIKVQGKELTLHLPKPQILVSKIDNEKTRVYNRKTGLFTKGNKDLEQEALQKAEVTIRSAACQANILEQASENAKKQLTTLFETVGFTKVTVIIPQAACQ